MGGGVSQGGQKITTKTLCDLIGSRYYQHNEEIDLNENRAVKVFDENDQLLGSMSLREAQMAAQSANKDVVLRNAKVDPPVVKIMNYKKELLKRLFKKLGKDMEEKDLKTKTIRLATNISFHDMETKKKQAKQFLKTFQILKLYMKVNIYDPENVQKGKLMLLNIAEDLKDDCKITVSPTKTREEQQKLSKASKPSSMAEIEKAAQKSKEHQDDFQDLVNEDLDLDELAGQSEFLYMELRSTSSFKDIDIDSMLEHTTFEDFMRGMYISKIENKAPQKGQPQMTSFDMMMSQF